MREEPDTRDVADRPHAVARAQAVVDRDPAPGDLDIELLEPEPVHGRAPARGDEEPLGLDCLSPSELEPESRVGRFGAFGLGFDQHAHAILLESLAKEVAGVRIEPREDAVVALDERHLRAHALEELGELDADRAATQDDERPRNRLEPDCVLVRPVRNRVEAVDVRNGGCRARRDDELVVRELAIAHRDDPGAHDACLPPNELSPLIGEPADVPRVVPTLRYLIPPPPHATDIDVTDDGFGSTRGDPRRGDDFGRPEQRLRRQARVVRAVASGQASLDDGDLGFRVEASERADEVLAARSRSEHDDATATHETERAGFEPATHLSARTRFPVALLRPLGHLSKEPEVTRRSARLSRLLPTRRRLRRPGSAARSASPRTTACRPDRS